MDIGRRLRRLRTDAGLTQEALAQRSRITAKYLSQIENGHSDPSVGVFLRLVELGLGMSLGAFFLEGGTADDWLVAIRALLAKQSPTMRRRALRVLKALVDE